MTREIFNLCFGFLFGTILGAASMYFGTKYTDQRREQEARSKKWTQFKNTQGKMPELIAEMKNDLSQPGQELFREFFVKRTWITLKGNDHRLCFVYYENEHPQLQEKIDILESTGYITDITSDNLPKYRMSEEFVELVLKSS